MKAEEFVAKFPDAMRKKNCLEDIACPECGNREMFRIQATIIAEVCDEGTDRDESDCEYDEKSSCECTECQFHGKLEDFAIEGLDDLLEKGKG
jgi:hypothetical protein